MSKFAGIDFASNKFSKLATGTFHVLGQSHVLQSTKMEFLYVGYQVGLPRCVTGCYWLKTNQGSPKTISTLIFRSNVSFVHVLVHVHATPINRYQAMDIEVVFIVFRKRS